MTMRTSDSTTIPCATLLLACIAGVGCSREAQLRLEPAVARDCDLPAATRVSWDVTGLGLNYVDIEVANLGEAPKFWIAGAAKGTETSGAWAQDGYTVTLKAKNGVVLARRTMTTTPCPG